MPLTERPDTLKSYVSLAELDAIGIDWIDETTTDPYEINGAARTDRGLKREQNEDAWVVCPELRLYAVADGMGGRRGGDIASNLALQSLRENIALADGSGVDESRAAMSEAIEQANADIFACAVDSITRRGMGTTLSALWIRGDRAVIGHVGDSRVYRLRTGNLERLTDDHSLAAAFARAGEEAHPRFSHVLTRAVGTRPEVMVDVRTIDVQPGDRFLLCSDGLTGMVDDDRISALISTALTADEAADDLLKAALRAGGNDNITAVVLDIEEH
jgi:serine/threonine protein phosphatase PrpC